MPGIAAVFFDVDGVLLDSLPTHLALCRELSARYGLGLSIPDAEAFKHIARSGVPISPMEAFFRAVGFPEAAARRGDTWYRAHFAETARIERFPGVTAMLTQLKQWGLPLGIVTANTRANIQKPLGDALSLFHPHCLFAHDTKAAPPKSEALRLGAARLGLSTAELLFVGDQPSDHRAAVEAGTQFLGVTYGWGIAASAHHPTAASPAAILAWVRARPPAARG